MIYKKVEIKDGNMMQQPTKKRKFFNEDLFIIKKNISIIFNGIFGNMNEIQVESAIAFSRYLNSVGINNKNYHLFLKLIQTNNKWIVDSLIGERDAKLLFSTIRPNKYIIKKAFMMLTLWHPKEIYPKVLLALTGIIESAYHNADDGHRIYKLKMADLYNIGKYLDQNKDQLEENNREILEILDRITKIGEFRFNIKKNIISKQAFNIRMAYFDNTKKLTDVIPHVLLINLKREDTEVNPSKNFINFLTGKKN